MAERSEGLAVTPTSFDSLFEEAKVVDPKEIEGEEIEEITELGSEVEDIKENTEEAEELSFTPFVQDLIDQNIIEIPEDIEFNDNIEGFRELINYNLESKINKGIEDRLSSMSENAQRLMEIEMRGGDIRELLELEAVDYNNVDIKDTDTQKLVLVDYYTSKGFSEEKANKFVENHINKEELELEAQTALAELAKAQKESIKNYEASIEDKQKGLEQLRVQEIEDLKRTVYSIDEVNGIPLDKQAKQDLYTYITKHVEKDENGRWLTQYDIDTYNVEDKIKLAFYLKNGFTNFDDIQRKAKTDTTKLIKEQLLRVSGKPAGVKHDKKFVTEETFTPTLEYFTSL